MVSACRICGCNTLNLFYTVGYHDKFRYYRCTECTLVHYDLELGLNQAKYAREFIDPNASHHQNDKQDNSFRAIKRFCKKGVDFLEIGCGNGRILQRAKQVGCNVMGLELSEYLAQSVAKKLEIEVVVADFLNWEYKGKKFDIVVLRHVLEHLPDPLLALNRICSLLNSGGILFIEVPDIDGLAFKYKRFIAKAGLHKKKYRADFIPGHCNEFNRKSFRTLLEKTGFAFSAWENYSNNALFDPVYKAFGLGCKARGIGVKRSR